MYVEWLLEFVWRIFIQGPLLFINFFTNRGNINKLLSSVSFINNQDLAILNSFVSLSIIIGFASVLFLMIFIYKIIKIIVANHSSQTKVLIINALKEFFKSIVIILVFTLIFNLMFVAFDVLSRSMDKAYNGIENDLKNPISKIPSYLYQFITNQPLANNNHNFMFPNDLLNQMDHINWIVGIIFVNSFSFFLLWMIWSIFQKMIEIFFLYLSFPISIAFGIETNQIHWKVWMKEIINKIALIFMLMLFLRLYLYMFYFICEYAIIGDKRWTKATDQIYIGLFVNLGLGGAMMFMSRMFSYKNQEAIGLIGAFKSFKQTSAFIIQNSFNQSQTNHNEIHYAPINENVESLKSEISYLNHHNNDYMNLKKIKLFDK